MTARNGYALLRPTARAMKWGPFVVATVLGLVILIVPEILSDRLTATHLTTLLRITAACIAVGVAFLLDDPATRSISTAPTAALIRHAVRAGIALPATGIGWAVALTVTTLGTKAAVAAALPRGALTLEAAALVAVAFGLAAGGLRFTTDGSAGTFAAPTLLVLLAVAWFIPRRAAMILAPTDPHWAASHRRWAAVLIAAVALFIWASREPTPHGHRLGRLVGRS
jgi:hypothetical protein